MQEEISAEEKSAEFICANLASILTFKFRKDIFQLGKLRKLILEKLIILRNWQKQFCKFIFKWFAHII